jgi:hypothetical protein
MQVTVNEVELLGTEDEGICILRKVDNLLSNKTLSQKAWIF